MLDVAQQAVHVTNQTRVYALIPEARNRLNTVYMSFSFIGTAGGSALGLLLWKDFNWPGVIIGNTVIILIAVIIYVLQVIEIETVIQIYHPQKASNRYRYFLSLKLKGN